MNKLIRTNTASRNGRVIESVSILELKNLNNYNYRVLHDFKLMFETYQVINCVDHCSLCSTHRAIFVGSRELCLGFCLSYSKIRSWSSNLWRSRAQNHVRCPRYKWGFHGNWNDKHQSNRNQTKNTGFKRQCFKIYMVSQSAQALFYSSLGTKKAAFSTLKTIPIDFTSYIKTPKKILWQVIVFLCIIWRTRNLDC